jgi:hypothetical protein
MGFSLVPSSLSLDSMVQTTTPRPPIRATRPATMAAQSKWLTTVTPTTAPSITRSAPTVRTHTSITPRRSCQLELLRQSHRHIRSRRSKWRAPSRRRLGGLMRRIRHRVARPHQPHQWAAMHTSLVRRRMSTHISACRTASLSLARTLILRQQSAARSHTLLLKPDDLYIPRRAFISRRHNCFGAWLCSCFSSQHHSVERRFGRATFHFQHNDNETCCMI